MNLKKVQSHSQQVGAVKIKFVVSVDAKMKCSGSFIHTKIRLSCFQKNKRKNLSCFQKLKTISVNDFHSSKMLIINAQS